MEENKPKVSARTKIILNIITGYLSGFAVIIGAVVYLESVDLPDWQEIGIYFTILTLFTLYMVWLTQKLVKKEKAIYAEEYDATTPLLSDFEIFNLILSQPDQLITPEELANQTALSKKEAKIRLNYLKFNKILKAYRKPEYCYGLAHNIDRRPPPVLSENPFMTIEDMLKLFIHFGGQCSVLDLLTATKLPVSVLRKELDYFIKEKVVRKLSSSVHTAYILNEPFRSDPKAFLEKEAKEMNLELEELVKLEQKKF